MSEKKYTPEEIRAKVDEAIRKAKLNARHELSPDEAQNVSGGNAYYDGDRRVLYDGRDYYDLDAFKQNAAIARSLVQGDDEDAAIEFLETMGYNLLGGYSKNLGECIED